LKAIHQVSVSFYQILTLPTWVALGQPAPPYLAAAVRLQVRRVGDQDGALAGRPLMKALGPILDMPA
jgi:hypothetical protein